MKELNSAIQKIEEIYVGDFDLDDNEKSIYNSKLKRYKSPKIVKSGEYEIKIVKYNTETIVGIPDVGFIVINNDADLKYLQWTRSYVSPDYRGRGILELLVQTALSNNIRPLILDYTLSIAAAKHFEKILKNPKFSVKIYNVDDDIILPYKTDAKIYHSPEGEFSSSHTGAEYEDAEKYVWLIENKTEVDFFTEDLEQMVKELKTYIPSDVENITFDYHDNSDESIKEGLSAISKELDKIKNISEEQDMYFHKKYGEKYTVSIVNDTKLSYPNKIKMIEESIDADLGELVKNHFSNNIYNNYYLTIEIVNEIDDNKPKLLCIIKENNNKLDKANLVFKYKLHIPFDYKEQLLNFLFELKLKFNDKYKIELSGISVEELKSDNLNEQLIKAENNIKNFYNKKFKDKDAKRFTALWGFDYNSAFAENANFELEEDLETISETFLKELDNLIKNNIIDIGINYILNILLTFDKEGKAIIIEIIKNEKKEQIPFKTVGLASKISFNYQEDIKNLLNLIILTFSNNYKIHLKGIPVEELKRNIKEGGGAFKHPEFAGKIRRIKREEIDKTLKYIAANITNHTNMDYEYLKNHVMGSTGKQADSGDIDIAVDEEYSSRETLVSISKKVRELFTQNYSKTEGLNAGQLNTLIPIEGDKEKGLVQVDFIIGNPEWLKFTHHSPGADVSPYKGVFISQALGVIAKMKKIWDYSDDEGERVGRIGWAYDLEKGLYIRTQVRKKPGQGMSKVSPDEFESFPWHNYGVNPPRVPRVGYINNPEEVVKILLGKSVKPKDIDTFEKLLAISKTAMGDKYSVFLERLKASLKRSSAQASMPKIAIDDLDIFKEN